MPPRKKYQCSVIVFDVNSEQTFKEEALKCYLNICGDRYFSEEDSDCSQLILINTKETRNRKNDENNGKYLNIVEATEMVKYDPANTKYIEEALPAQGNWIEGVEVAVEELLTHADSTMFDAFHIIVFSELSAPLAMEKRDINAAVKSIIKQLCQMDGYIYFLGPDISVPKMLCTKKDVFNWMQNLEPRTENDNIDIAIQILQECYGVICDLNVGLELVKSYKYSKRGYPFVEPLKFGELEIFTSCVKYLDCKPLLNIKRDEEGFNEIVYVHAKDQSQEIDRNNVINGLALHNKLVIIPNDVRKGIKEYNRFFKLLGFTDISNVPEDYMLASSTSIITPYDQKDPEIGAINYIIKACFRLQKYGIALRAYMKNCRPKLYCLIPKLEPLCFTAVELPYAEDYNILYGTKDCSTIKFKDDAYSDYENVPALKDDIYAYLDSMYMNDEVKVHPYLRENSGKRKIVSNLVRKIKGEEIIETPLPLNDLQVSPPADLYEAVNRNWFATNATENNDVF